jgi:outer membrane protein assembly factor BamB
MKNRTPTPERRPKKINWPLSLGIYNSMVVRTLAVADGLSSPAPDIQQPLWASDRHDAVGSLSVPISLEQQPQLLWSVKVPGGPSGGPAVAADGTIYVAGVDKVLMALAPSGATLWQATLEESPVGAPALDSQGRIFVADNRGGVTAVDSQGNLLWRAPGTGGREATAGPILDASGNIYMTVVDAVAAISPQGELMWYTPAADIYLQEPPRLSPDQTRVYLKNTAMLAESGAPLNITIRPAETLLFSDPAFFGGANGLDYYRAGHEIIGWHYDDGKLVMEEGITWNNQNTIGLLPVDQGVTRNGLAWLFYSNTWTDSEMVWLDAQSRLLGDYIIPRPNCRLIAIGAADEAYICGANLANIECINIKPGAEMPTWNIQLDNQEIVAGGSLIPGRLLVAVANDGLYVFGGGP